MNLRTKIILAFTTIVVTAVVIAILVSSVYISRRFDDISRKKIISTLSGIEKEYEAVELRAKSKVFRISGLKELKRRLLIRAGGRIDRLALMAFTEELKSGYELDILEIFDAECDVLAMDKSGWGQVDTKRSKEVMRYVLEKRKTITSIEHERIQGKDFLVIKAISPITHLGMVVGGVSGGYVLSQEVIERFKEISGAEVTLYSPKGILSTRGDPYYSEELIDDIISAKCAKLEKTVLHDETFQVGGFPLLDYKGHPVGVLLVGISGREVEDLIWSLQRFFLLLGAFGVVVVSLTGFVLSGRVTRPLQALVKGAKAVSDGDLEYRISTKASGEIRELIQAFNKMTRDLLKNKRELLRTERIAAWQDIARRLAHEIKNPLTPIQLSIQNLKKLYKSREFDEVFEETTRTILDEVERLRHFVNEFSSFARLPSPRFERCNLNEIVKEVSELYKTSSDQVRFSLDLNDSLPEVFVDRDQIAQVVGNLIKNALEAMPTGGELRISTQRTAKWAIMKFEDEGCGIPDDVKAKVFDPYFTSKTMGSGLGLSISQRIISQHRGRIWFESTEGHGTTFVIEIPLSLKDQNGSVDSLRGFTHDEEHGACDR